MNSKNNQDALRLNHYLSLGGAGSRRACEQYIRDGRVAVNGETVTDPSVRITGEEVTLNGRKIELERASYYLALHKPPGYICSSEDPSGRPLALDLVSAHIPARLYTVGRLDFMSSGLILVTNDGEFAKTVSHPSSMIEKEYIVETKQPVRKEFLEQCKRGIVVERVTYRVKRYDLQTSRKVRLVLLEGKKREIRNMFSSARITIKRLHRVRIGPVHLGTMKPAAFRRLKPSEIRILMNTGKRKKS